MWTWSDSLALNFLDAGEFGRRRPLSVSAAFPRVDSSMAFERRDDRADSVRATVNRVGRRRWKRSSVPLSAAASTTSIERMAWAFIDLQGTRNFDDVCWVAALRLQSLPETAKICRKINGINAKMRFLAQTKGRREKERERKRKGKEEEGKEKGKGEGEREIGSEALAETEKIANAPAGNRTRNPSKRGWCSTIEPPRQAISPASLFEIVCRKIQTMANERSINGAKKRKWRKTKDFHSLVVEVVAGGDWRLEGAWSCPKSLSTPSGTSNWRKMHVKSGKSTATVVDLRAVVRRWVNFLHALDILSNQNNRRSPVFDPSRSTLRTDTRMCSPLEKQAATCTSPSLDCFRFHWTELQLQPCLVHPPYCTPLLVVASTEWLHYFAKH